MIPRRKLNNSGIEVSLIGFGTWQIGGPIEVHGKPKGVSAFDERANLDLLDKAFEKGINFFETSNNYGQSERLLGIFSRKKRDKIVIASKCGYSLAGEVDTSFQFICSSIEDSLRKLKTDYIDIYQLTMPYTKNHNILEVVHTLEIFKKQGKVRMIGLSLKNYEDGEYVTNEKIVDVIEVMYNLFDVRFNREVLPACKRKNIGVIIKSPLNTGFLTGKYYPETTFDSNDLRSGYLDRETLIRRNNWIKAFCKDFCIERSTLREVALNFVLSNPNISTVALGMRNIKQLEENVSIVTKPCIENRLIDQMEHFALEHWQSLGGIS